jgi:hypothetical protein
VLSAYKNESGVYTKGIRYHCEIVTSLLGPQNPSYPSMQHRKVAVEDTGPTNTSFGGAAALTYEPANNNPPAAHHAAIRSAALSRTSVGRRDAVRQPIFQ